MFAYILARQKALARQLYRRLVGNAPESVAIDRSSGQGTPGCAFQMEHSSDGSRESPTDRPDDSSQPATPFEPSRTCPRCGEPMVGVASTGPDNHVITPCGCRMGGIPDVGR